MKASPTYSERDLATQTLICNQLVDCFEQVFQIKGAAPDDDFFELGGDSLSATQLFVEIESRFGVRISSSQLIQHTSISQLAGVIGLEPDVHFKAAIVPVKKSGNLAPIFMTHGYSGNLWVAQNLARHLREDQPLYGISPDIDNLKFANFQELAEQNVETLITEHPRDDYRLIGHSFGGVLAYEMARQLRAKGYTVSFLGMIDSDPNLGMGHRSGPGSLLARINDYYHRYGLSLTRAWFTQSLHRWVRNKQSSSSLPEVVADRSPALQSTRHHGESLFVQKATNAFYSYFPGAYAGDLTIFITDQENPAEGSFIAGCWGKLTSGRVEVIPVTGSHLSIVSDPHIQQIAEKLNKL